MAAPLSPNLDWNLANPIWAQAINPVLANPLNDISLLTNIVLANGVTIIAHRLNRMQRGWFLTDINGAATIYRSDSFNTKTLTLTSSALVTVSIGVF